MSVLEFIPTYNDGQICPFWLLKVKRWDHTEAQKYFRQHRWTATAIHSFLGSIQGSTDRGTNSLSLFHFYQIKAYDFIYHGILLAKLVSYGTWGTTNLTLNLHLLYSKNLVVINKSDGIVYTIILHLLLQKWITECWRWRCEQHAAYWNDKDIVKH
jgi:hypothetical protein